MPPTRQAISTATRTQITVGTTSRWAAGCCCVTKPGKASPAANAGRVARSETPAAALRAVIFASVVEKSFFISKPSFGAKARVGQGTINTQAPRDSPMQTWSRQKKFRREILHSLLHPYLVRAKN